MASMFPFLSDRKSNAPSSSYDSEDFYSGEFDDFDDSNMSFLGSMGGFGMGRGMQGMGQINAEALYEHKVIHKDFYNEFDDDCDDDDLE